MKTSSSGKPSTRLKRVGLLLAGLLGWILGALLLIWLTAPSWILPLLQHLNQDEKWWDTLDFGVSHIDAQNLQIEYLRFQKENINIYTDGLSITYKPSELLQKRIDSVLVKPLRIDLDIEPFLSSASKTDLDEENEASKQSFDWITLLGAHWTRLPYQQLLASDIDLNLQAKDQPPIHMDAMLLTQADDQAIRAQTSVHFFEESLSLDTHLSLENPSDRHLNLSLHLWNPMDLVHRIQPLLPSNFSNTIESFNLTLGAVYGSLDWLGSDELLSAQFALSQASYDTFLDIRGATLEAEGPQDLSVIKGHIELTELRFPKIGSTALQGELEIKQPTSPKLTVESSWQTSGWIGELNEEAQNSNLLEPITASIRYSENKLELETPELSSPLIPASFENIILSLNFPEADRGFLYALSSQLVPKVPGWTLIPIADPGNITLKVEGESTPVIEAIESFQTRAKLLVSEHSISGKIDTASEKAKIAIAGKVDGETDASVNGSEVQLNTHLNLKEFKATQSQDFRMEANAELTLFSAFDALADWSSTETVFKNLRETDLNLKLNGKGAFTSIPFSIKQLDFELFPLEKPTVLKSEFPFNITADQVKWDVWKLLNPSGTGTLNDKSLSIQLNGSLIQKDLVANADYTINWLTNQQKGTIRLQNSGSEARTTLALHEIFPDMATTIVSAVISAEMKIITEGENLKLPLSGSITDAQLTMPNSGFSVEGLQFPDIAFADLISGATDRPLHLKISKIDYAPYIFNNLDVQVSITPNYTLQVEHLSFEFCQGRFDITFKKPIQAPYDNLSCRVEFKAVDIKQLTDLIPDFKENLTGKMDGYLPFTFSKGEISWGRGKANLTPGTTARLRYAENGLFAAYIPEIVISKELDIDINKALRDITITEMTLDIQPSAQFDQPSILVMSGHSNNSKIEIPIERIQLNIRAGDIPGLINRSLQSQEWLQSLMFQK